MINFENRQVQFKNRKLLTIVDKSYNENGDLATLKVDVARCEGEVINEGTELKAEVLNSILNEISLIKRVLFNINYTIDTTEGTLCQGDKGAGLTYVLTLDEDFVFGLNASSISEYFTVTYSKTGNEYRINVEEKDAVKELNRTGLEQFTFDINIYLEDEVTLVDTITCIINYQYLSTNTGE